MIPKEQRIKRGEFEEILKKGRTYHSDLFSLRFLYEKTLKNSHFSVVVSKKVAKNATERSKIKRRLYYILKKHSRVPKKPYFVAFFVKKDIKNIKFKDLEEKTLKVLKNVEK